MTELTIRQIGPGELGLYQSVPIRFRVESIYRVEPVDDGRGGLALVEESVARSYVKDYDGDPDRQERPAHWRERFDVSNWLFLLAFEGSRPVGAAAVAFRSPGLDRLEGRDDLAVLWDFRVHPDSRRQGIGSALFRRAAEWARAQGCTRLKIETQNVNVAACRFYAAHGCRLTTIDCDAYANVPHVAHETMLLWSLDLPAPK